MRWTVPSLLDLLTSCVLLTACILLTACSGPDPWFPDGGSDDYMVADDSLSCEANNDGRIEMSELLFKAGVSVTYRVNPPGTIDAVNVEGQLEEGLRIWDHSSLKGVVVKVNVEAIADAWYKKHFSAASFATGADVKADNLQLIQVDEQGQRVLLLGLASRQPDQTLMIYSPPIEIMRFPMERGLSFTSTGEVENGMLDGLPIATKDTYEVSVDEEGTVRLPSLELRRSLRMRVKVTSKAVGGVSATVLQHQWFHECLGEAVRSVSPPTTDGSQPDPSKAAEYRRLSF